MPDFRFRLPSINDLTDLQQVAFYERRPILITGGPGSGKTVVSVFRFLRQITEDQNALFFTFNRTLMASIRGTLRQQADTRLPDLDETEVEEIIESKIASMYEWYGAKFHVMLSQETDENITDNFNDYNSNQLNAKYSEVFIDEAQDLRSGIISGTYGIASKLSCGADRSQDLQGQYVGPADDSIYQILNTHVRTIRQGLTSNFRNTKEIFDFARSFVPEDDNVQQINTDELNTGEIPEIMGNLNEQEQLNTIVEIIRQNPNSNIGILVHTRPQIITIKAFIESKGYSCNRNAADNVSFSYYYSGMPANDKNIVESRLKTPFILTFESCKGLEFDIVIMPFFEWANIALNGQRRIPNGDGTYKNEYNADGTPKMWAIPNHYYVAVTRARNLLYLLFNNKPDILDFWEEENNENLFDNNSLTDLPF